MALVGADEEGVGGGLVSDVGAGAAELDEALAEGRAPGPGVDDAEAVVAGGDGISGRTSQNRTP